MGANKALLPLGETSLIGHVIQRLRGVTDELLLVTNDPTEYAHLGLPMHGDIFPGTGALGGIYTGVTHAAADAVVCVACDSPFLEPSLLTYLLSVLGDDHDAVMPFAEGYLQPLCAVYSPRCLPIIDRMVAESELRVHALAARASVRRIAPEVWRQFDPAGMSFFNINTPAALARARASLA